MGSCLSTDGGQCQSPYSLAASSSRSRRKGLTKKHNSDSKREEQFRKIQGRVIYNGASKGASLFTQQGRKGMNQDAMIVWENFGSRTDTVFCGVFDGHGPFGHVVAKRVRDSLPLRLCANLELSIGNDDGLRDNISTAGSMTSEDALSVSMEDDPSWSTNLDEKERLPDIFFMLRESFLNAFKVMDKELKLHPNINCYCSGTTAVTLVKQGQDLVIGNIGDSRAVLGTRDQDNKLVAVQLTVDLKPNVPREAERIRQCKGRVFALHDEPEVTRVWLPHCDSPGLAMARAFGDFCLKDFGLISVPEVSYRYLTEKDEFVVLATDGIWDVLSNVEVVEVIASARTRSSAARSLVESAVRAWRYKYPTSKMDDCAVVCLFLDSNAKDDDDDDGDDRVKAPNLESTEASKSVTADGDLPSLSFGRSTTVGTGFQISQDNKLSSPAQRSKGGPTNGGQDTPVRGGSTKSGMLDDIPVGTGDEWSALEGVTRANTLLTLPRFVPGEK